MLKLLNYLLSFSFTWISYLKIDCTASHAGQQVTTCLLSNLMISSQNDKNLDELCVNHTRSNFLMTKQLEPLQNHQSSKLNSKYLGKLIAQPENKIYISASAKVLVRLTVHIYLQTTTTFLTFSGFSLTNFCFFCNSPSK